MTAALHDTAPRASICVQVEHGRQKLSNFILQDVQYAKCGGCKTLSMSCQLFLTFNDVFNIHSELLRVRRTHIFMYFVLILSMFLSVFLLFLLG